MEAEPRRVVSIGVELKVTTGQLTDDTPALTAIRSELAQLADRLMIEAPGSKEVTLIWAVDRAPEV